MKIGFFGNTNNTLLVVAQAMQSLGHEVILVVHRKELLHRPESRFPEYYNGYPEWILDSSQFNEWDYISLDPKIAPVLEALSDCDALFLNDLGPSLLPVLERPAIAFLTGSDLTFYANFQTLDVRSDQWSEGHKKTYEAKLWKRLFVDFIQRQREGIRSSVAVRYFPSGIDLCGDALLAEIGVPDSKRIFQYITDLKGNNPTPPLNNKGVRVYCPVRLTWKLPIESGYTTLDYKGSDIMIRGLGLFHRKTGTKLNIVLMRKGLHVTDLEKIIVDEGLADQVTWLDEMSLIAYRKEIAQSDIILEQFGDSIVAGIGLDAMASARPVIGNVRPEIMGDAIPICQARTPEQICAQLERLVFHPQERERVGKAGREYVEKYTNIDDYARICLKYLEVPPSSQDKAKTSSYSGLLYYLQQRHLLLEENITQEYIIQENSEREAEFAKAASAREAELLGYLRSYAVAGEKSLKRTLLKEPYLLESGLCWAVTLVDFLSIADSEEHPRRSTLLLYEDDKLLQPSHAVHEDIRSLGGGRYSHWNEALFFSTSDGSDPNTNGREYRIVYTGYVSSELKESPFRRFRREVLAAFTNLWKGFI